MLDVRKGGDETLRVLVIEDEPKVARFIERGLREERFTVEVSSDGEDGLHRALHSEFDLIVLDVMLPGISGFEVLRRLRAAGRPDRVLVLTARDEVGDRVRGLEGGADDYLTKPFSFAEFLARVRALLRRRRGDAEEPDFLAVGDLTLDTRARRVRRAGRVVGLSAREYAVLEYLVRHAGQVVSRTRLAEAIWDEQFESFSNVIDVTVYHLREKLDRGFGEVLIRTVRGGGIRAGVGGEWEVMNAFSFPVHSGFTPNGAA
jgi:two-component system copper resistance phosphate regulon response regulator CusR